MTVETQGLPTPGQRLFARRRALGLSQAELAERFGISGRALQDLESGKSAVKDAYLLAVEYVALQLAAERKSPMLASTEGRTLALEIAEAIKGA